jgi:hypothetical protein
MKLGVNSSLNYVVRFQGLTAESMMLAVFRVVAPCSLIDVYLRFAASIIVLMKEAASASETSVKFYKTSRKTSPQDRRFHTRNVYVRWLSSGV